MRQAKTKVVDNHDIKTDEFLSAIQELAESKGISKDVIMDAMAEALKKAYLKYSGDDPTDTILDVRFDPSTGAISMYKIKRVVEEITDDVFETDPEEAKLATGKDYKVGDNLEIPINILDFNFRRAAAMQAKNVFKQKLREAEKQAIYDQFNDKIHDNMVGIIERVEPNYCIVKLNNVNAYLAKSNCLPGDTLIVGRQLKVYIEDVDNRSQGTQIVVSRTSPGFVKRLMEEEIAEIYEGKVEIKAIARNAGVRTKVAVSSNDLDIDPSGACIGQKGMRINNVIKQINNESIDVINYSDDPILFIADALKPAYVLGVSLNEKEKSCCVVVPDGILSGSTASEFSKAIGRGAYNVNLAVKLTGYKIDIKTQSDADAEGIAYILVEAEKEAYEYRKLVAKAKANAKPEVVEEPVKQEEKVVETVKEEKVEKVEPTVEVETPKEKEVEEVIPASEIVTPTKTSSTTVSAFNEYEEALSSSKPAQQTTERKPKKKKEEEKPEKEEKTTQVKPTVNLPVYTEEELADIEAEEAEEENKYDDDIDYDEFDEYYDE